jgi:uncharacterized protein with PIN domain
MDVHIPRAITTGLRIRGVDVVTAQQDNSAMLDDSLLLQRASKLNRVLVTQDDDLLRECKRLREGSQEFTGIIYAHQLRVTIGQMISDLELIAKATTNEEWRNRIEFLPLG